MQRLSFLLIGILLLGVGIFTAAADSPQTIDPERLFEEGYIGLEEALVEVVEYGAYGCATCRSIFQSALVSDVMTRYEGAVKYTFRNIPGDHPNDAIAAEAAQCALDQGLQAFWGYHNAIFGLTDEAYNALSTLSDFATVSPSVDAPQLEACLAEGTHTETVAYWQDQGTDIDLAQGSVFTLNGEPLEAYWELDSEVLAAAQARISADTVQGTLNEDTPIQIIEYGSYGCHACRVVHESGVVQNVMANYGDRVQFVFRNFPFISPNDPLAAQAAQCVFDQGEDAFWTYHEALYDLTDGDYATYDEATDYVALANDLGLDGDAVDRCLAAGKHELTMIVWAQHGQDIGVRATPTFIVNGQQVDPFQLEAVIIAALGQ